MRKCCIMVALAAGIVVAADAQTRNFKLIDSSDTARMTTPTVAINHKDPNNWVVGVSPDHTVYTQDGGKTWGKSLVAGAFTFYGDPAVEADGKGTFVYLYTAGQGETGPDRIVSRSSPDGKTWTEEVTFANPAAKESLRPRPGMQRGTVYVTWTQRDAVQQKDSACQSNVLLSMSSNEGKKWSDPVQISQTPGECTSNAQTMQASAPVINADGKFFIAWVNQGTISIDRSYDAGRTWLSNDLSIGKLRDGGRSMIPGVKAYGTPVLAVDNSGSYFRGALYLTWADQPSGETDTDIRFMRSTNRGDFWSQPTRVNADSLGKQQFSPSMVVDETSGIIYIVYYDRRNYDDLQTDVYLAYSTDGGTKFTDMKISETPFVPVLERPVAFHTALAVFKGVIVPVWTRIDNGIVTTWSAPLKQSDFIKSEEVPRTQPIQRRR